MAKQPRCKHCKKEFVRTFTTTQAVCSPLCGLKLAEIKRKKKYDQITKEKKKKLRESDLKHQKALTQTVFNRMRVLQELKWFFDRGLQPTCISCGNELGNDQWCCGHFKTVKAQPVLRYDEKNTYLQHNVNCNKHLSGDISGTKHTHGYIAGLHNRFGKDAAGIIEYCSTNNKPADFTCDWLKSFRAECSKKIRELEKELL